MAVIEIADVTLTVTMKVKQCTLSHRHFVFILLTFCLSLSVIENSPCTWLKTGDILPSSTRCRLLEPVDTPPSPHPTSFHIRGRRLNAFTQPPAPAACRCAITSPLHTQHARDTTHAIHTMQPAANTARPKQQRECAAARPAFT